MRQMMIIKTLILFCCLGGAVNAQTSLSKEKEQHIRRLLELTRASEMGTQVIEQSLAQVRIGLATIPANVRNKILVIYEEEMRKDFSGEKMIEVAIPIYDKYLSLDELKQLIVVYESPIGQKLVNVLPQITRESFDQGARMGAVTARRITARLQAEGLLITPLDPPVPQTDSKPVRKTGRRRPRP